LAEKGTNKQIISNRATVQSAVDDYRFKITLRSWEKVSRSNCPICVRNSRRYPVLIDPNVSAVFLRRYSFCSQRERVFVSKKRISGCTL